MFDFYVHTTYIGVLNVASTWLLFNTLVNSSSWYILLRSSIVTLNIQAFWCLLSCSNLSSVLWWTKQSSACKSMDLFCWIGWLNGMIHYIILDTGSCLLYKLAICFMGKGRPWWFLELFALMKHSVGVWKLKIK